LHHCGQQSRVNLTGWIGKVWNNRDTANTATILIEIMELLV
jgi:hypothetical protein